MLGARRFVLIIYDFVQRIDQRVRCYLMCGIINPSRSAKDAASKATISQPVQHKTDAEAVEDWEDEGGASSHSGESIVVNSSPVPGSEARKEAKCT